MYLVNLMSVPQEPEPSLTNKVLPEQEGSPLARLLLMASRKREDGEGAGAPFVSGDYSIPFPAELKTAWKYYQQIIHLLSLRPVFKGIKLSTHYVTT
jgi:hypothetical protein